MEMFFLQHATGVANTPLAESTLRSISGTSASIDFNLSGEGEDPRYRFRANSEMDPNSIEVSKLERESIEVDRALEVCNHPNGLLKKIIFLPDIFNYLFNYLGCN